MPKAHKDQGCDLVGAHWRQQEQPAVDEESVSQKESSAKTTNRCA